ncbi:MAG: hypothetical protein JWN46_3226, partial [Acidimicrobiales bacterium]|nr:hypothetical protein [Acidimicrobiales bacterium]
PSQPVPQPHRRFARVAAAVAALVVVAGVVGSVGHHGGSPVPGSTSASSGTAYSSSGGGSPATTVVASSLAGQGGRTAANAGGTNAADSSSSKSPSPSAVTPADAATPGGSGRTGATGQTGPAVAPKVIRNGTIDLELDKGAFQGALERLTNLAKGSGGFLTQTQTDEVDGRPRGSFTLRVPSDRFDATVVQARRLGHVLSANQNGQDVSGEYTDLDSRLRAAKAERDQIQVVLSQAHTIGDILAVRDRLNQVQTDIETMQGRKNVLDDQTSLSTLTVSMHEKGDNAQPIPTVPAPRTGFAKAWHEAIDRFNGGLQAVVAGSGTVALLALVAAVLWFVGRPLYRRTRRPLVAEPEPAREPVATTAPR